MPNSLPCAKCGKLIIVPFGKTSKVTHQECVDDAVLDKIIAQHSHELETCNDEDRYFNLINWIRDTRQEKARRAGLCQGVYTYPGKFGIDCYIHCEQPGKLYQAPNGRIGCYCDEHVSPTWYRWRR